MERKGLSSLRGDIGQPEYAGADVRADGRPDGNRVVNRAGIARLRGLPQERDAVFAPAGVEGQNRIAQIGGGGLDQLNQRVARAVAADGLARTASATSCALSLPASRRRQASCTSRR